MESKVQETRWIGSMKRRKRWKQLHRKFVFLLSETLRNMFRCDRKSSAPFLSSVTDNKIVHHNKAPFRQEAIDQSSTKVWKWVKKILYKRKLQTIFRKYVVHPLTLRSSSFYHSFYVSFFLSSFFKMLRKYL